MNDIKILTPEQTTPTPEQIRLTFQSVNSQLADGKEWIADVPYRIRPIVAKALTDAGWLVREDMTCRTTLWVEPLGSSRAIPR